ncbi:MAG: Hsp20/alpha crystallin family protein [Candidatus Thermoplasmatota archaeon]|nr:Hsp20/alpha crystallin family protein [Candidatus Thermoplasmatota archaeon]
MGDRKRRRWPFDDDDDFFSYFDEIFDDMRKRMEKVLSGSLKDFDTTKPFVWGYSFRMGPDGKPEFRQFGDTEGLRPMTGESRREPLTDVIEKKDSISITVELPGVEKEDIELKTTSSRVVIEVDHPERRYHRDIDLPAPVNPDSVKATFKNGVLDVILDKVKGDTGKRVSID